MVTATKLHSTIIGKSLVDMVGLSTDTKPTTGVANGSKLLEMDTSTVYAFDEANGEWLAQSSSGGGGGGGVEPLIVNIVESADTAICDKTAGEIKAALDNGVPAYFKVTTTTEGWSNSIKTVQIISVETEERAGETEGVFDEFTVSFGSTNGTYSTMSNTSLEDALSKYPETN